MACILGLDDDTIAIRKSINATRCHNVFAKAAPVLLWLTSIKKCSMAERVKGRTTVSARM